MADSPNIRQFVVNLALKFQGTLYRWGGSSPRSGFDCSGFVVWIFQVFGLLPSGDWTAEGLRQRFVSKTPPEPGDLVFYGPSSATHVMIYAGDNLVVGASGGNSTTLTEADAIAKNAMVKIKPLHYRSDFLDYGKIL